ncbi:MAG TPA: DUF4936 family protein [Zeimonas sp.]
MSALVVLVWFRAEPARNEECLRALHALAGRMEIRFGLRGRFGWRDEPEKKRRTWLESWEPLDDTQEEAFVDALADEATALGFDALATGGRFVEVFRWAGAAKGG